MANVKPKIVFGMHFLTMTNVDINFQAQILQWRFYTTGDVILTIKQVELIEKKEFIVVVLDLEYEALVVHVAALNIDPGDEIHLSKRAQIVLLKADEVLI